MVKTHSVKTFSALLLVFAAIISIAMLPSCSPATGAVPSGKSADDAAAHASEDVFLEVSDIPAPPDEVAEMLAEMPLEDKVAAMFMVAPEALSPDGSAVIEAGQLEAGLRNRPVCGICWFAKNAQAPGQLSALLSEASLISSERSGLPLLDAVDEEGGLVSRIASNPAFGVEDAGDAADVADADAAYRRGAYIGSYLAALGFEVDFAPVCDVPSGPSDVMWRRAFPGGAKGVGELAAAEAAGLESAGVTGCVKHFPGIGGAVGGDSHENAIVNDADAEEILAAGGSAFRRALAGDAEPFVMVGHLCCPQADPEHPASLSREVIGGLLREELGFDGIVITDSLQMGAVTGSYPAWEAAVLAVEAGCDIVLMPEYFDAAYDGLLEAAKSGRVSETRLDESLMKTMRKRLAVAEATE